MEISGREVGPKYWKQALCIRVNMSKGRKAYNGDSGSKDRWVTAKTV